MGDRDKINKEIKRFDPKGKLSIELKGRLGYFDMLFKGAHGKERVFGKDSDLLVFFKKLPAGIAPDEFSERVEANRKFGDSAALRHRWESEGGTMKELIEKKQELVEASIGWQIMDKLISQKDVRKIRKMSDEQTGKLAVEVYRELLKRIDDALGYEGQEALNRLSKKSNFRPDDTGLTRNNIFKAAHALKMKLPSMMF